MIFPVIEVEPIVQVNDKTRISATKSFTSGEATAVTLVRIRASASDPWIVVTGSDYRDWYLDWSYASSGALLPEVAITTNATAVTKTGKIQALGVSSDYLFSTDADLQAHESDILKWVSEGRSSFVNVHREAQTIIIDWLNREGYVNGDGVPFTKSAVVDLAEVREWSKYVTLRLIMESVSNATDDIFHKKALRYGELEVHARNRSFLRLDSNDDGIAGSGEGLQVSSGFVVRR